jgi:type IV pilus assembly protein PilC
MPNFKYRAVSNDGATVNGIVEAYDEFEAIDRIKQTCRFVSSIQQVDRTELNLLEMNVGTPKIKENILALMCSQFSIVIKAGMPIVRAVELIAGQTQDKTLKNLLKKVSEDVAAGYGLAQSFENKGGKLMPTSFIETVRAGEESGTLDVSFARLYTYFDRSFRIKKMVRGAMTQPIFLLLLAIAVIIIVMTVAMPVFIDLFEDGGVELPGLTQGLIDIYRFFGANWLYFLIGIAVIIIALVLWRRTEKGRLFFARLKLNIPVLGNIAEMKGASQLANTLSTLLTAGLTLVSAVEICSRVLDNYYLSTQLATAVGGIEEGKPLSQCLRRCECFPALLVEMAAVGDETGSLEDTLNTIGEYYDSETELASSQAMARIQPIITVVMGVFVGVIVIALYLPMFNMGSAIG